MISKKDQRTSPIVPMCPQKESKVADLGLACVASTAGQVHCTRDLSETRVFVPVSRQIEITWE